MDSHFNKQLKAIQSLVRGEIAIDLATRKANAVDGSIFTILPAAVFRPQDTYDIQAVAHYLFAQAQSNTPTLSLTARGKGSDQAGGPLGAGIILDTQRLNQIIEMGHDYVRVQPGLRYGELQNILKQHGRYLAPYPASIEICTIGGAVANNSAGEKTVKYGNTRDYVSQVSMVLANGEVASFHTLTRAEATAKKQHRSMESHIYREIDRIISKQLPKLPFTVTKNSTGYNLWGVKTETSFDLTKLIVGSQGTLGIITDITLRTLPYPTSFALMAGYFDSVEKAASAVTELRHLGPSALEIVDHHLLGLVRKSHPEHLSGLLPKQMPQIVLVVEFDDTDLRDRYNKVRATRRILNSFAFDQKEATDPVAQKRLWNIRRSAAALIWTVKSEKKALPIVEDGIVPTNKLPEFFKQAYALFDKYNLQIAIWGHAGDANLHMQPFLDLAQKSDREKIWPFVDEFHDLIISMGGSISGEHNDGIMRTPYLKQQYGNEILKTFQNVKRVFDPYNYLNPGKKVGITVEDAKKLMRRSYDLAHLVDDHRTITR
jgi:FAD/FMN-containing dehydrogenase